MEAANPEPVVPASEPPSARLLLSAAALGAVGSAAALLFVGLVAAGQHVFWPNDIDPSAFSGSIRMPLIMAGAGLAVGLVHRFVPSASEVNIFGALVTGAFDRRAVPGGVAIALITLVGGFSLGPEVPIGMAAAGLASWIAIRSRALADDEQIAMAAAITGGWGGLFTSPFTAVLLDVELASDHRTLRWVRFVTDSAGAVVGFTIFFVVEAGWADLLSLLDLPTYALEAWHLLAAIGIGLVGGLVGTLFKLSALVTRRLAAPFANRPVLRGTLVGLAFGLVGIALPLTLFLGTDGLDEVVSDPQALGAGLILASAAVKILVTTGALSTGFVGGPIFPLLFVGGSIGSVIHLASSEIPLALAVSASMAAVPSAVVPAPLSISILTILIAGVGQTEAVPVLLAAVVALYVGRVLERALRQRQVST